jgi:hypothetical protein
MSSILYSFNGENLRTVGSISTATIILNNESYEQPADLAEQEIPRRQGSVVQAARKKSRLIKITGTIQQNTTADDLQTIVDALRAATSPLTGVQALYAGRDDRYWQAQRESFTESYGTGGEWYGKRAMVDMTFRAADPDAYAASAGVPVTPTSVGLSVGSTNVTPTGDSATHPIYSLTMGSGTGLLTVSNSLSGETCNVSGTFATSDVITLNAPEGSYGSFLNGNLNYGLFTGAIPRLWPGVNPIAITIQLVDTATITGTPTGGSFTLTYGGQTTTIAWNASASAMQTALAALSSIGAGNVTVTGANGGPYTITLALSLGNGNAITASGAGLTGGSSPGVTIATLSPTVSAAGLTYVPRYA